MWLIYWSFSLFISLMVSLMHDQWNIRLDQSVLWLNINLFACFLTFISTSYVNETEILSRVFVFSHFAHFERWRVYLVRFESPLVLYWQLLIDLNTVTLYRWLTQIWRLLFVCVRAAVVALCKLNVWADLRLYNRFKGVVCVNSFTFHL